MKKRCRILLFYMLQLGQSMLIFFFYHRLEIKANALAKQFHVGVHLHEHLGLVYMLFYAHFIDCGISLEFLKGRESFVERFAQLLTNTLFIVFICHGRHLV